MDPEEQLRNEAWIGDAVLALFARSWLLRIGQGESSKDRSRLFELWVSNQFLSSFGEPTSVEAEIGRTYSSGGLDAAFAFIEQKLLDRFVQTARKRGFNLTAPGKTSTNSVEPAKKPARP
jgi:dsRNA-specific ribonuclease